MRSPRQLHSVRYVRTKVVFLRIAAVFWHVRSCTVYESNTGTCYLFLCFTSSKDKGSDLCCSCSREISLSLTGGLLLRTHRALGLHGCCSKLLPRWRKTKAYHAAVPSKVCERGVGKRNPLASWPDPVRRAHPTGLRRRGIVLTTRKVSPKSRPRPSLSQRCCQLGLNPQSRPSSDGPGSTACLTRGIHSHSPKKVILMAERRPYRRRRIRACQGGGC